MRNAILLLLLVCSSVLASFEGYATYFDAVGYPYGACGVPDSVAWNEAAKDTASGQGNPFHYVALNVFDDSGDYSSSWACTATARTAVDGSMFDWATTATGPTTAPWASRSAAVARVGIRIPWTALRWT
jgi:hypothetical protein